MFAQRSALSYDGAPISSIQSAGSAMPTSSTAPSTVRESGVKPITCTELLHPAQLPVAMLLPASMPPSDSNV